MLSLAIATTLVGFALLVVGLITGQVWFAIACIGICLIGVGLLIADVIRSGRAPKETTPEPVSVIDDAPAQPRAVVRSPAPPVQQQPRPGPVPPPPAPRRQAAPLPSELSTPSADAARFADDATPTSEGSFNDYLAATTGEFATTAAPQPQPEPRQPSGSGVSDSGVRWESSIPPQQSEFIDREASNWSPAVQPRESEQQPRSRHGRRAGASGMPAFDPLDPNWHPPAD